MAEGQPTETSEAPFGEIGQLVVVFNSVDMLARYWLSELLAADRPHLVVAAASLTFGTITQMIEDILRSEYVDTPDEWLPLLKRVRAAGEDRNAITHARWTFPDSAEGPSRRASIRQLSRRGPRAFSETEQPDISEIVDRCFDIALEMDEVLDSMIESRADPG